MAAPTDQHQYSLTVKGVGTWRNLLPHASKSQAKSELACLALKALGYRAVQLPLTHDGSSAGYKLAVQPCVLLCVAVRPPPTPI